MSKGRRKRTPRWHKAVALLPLVALSGAWSADAAPGTPTDTRTGTRTGSGADQPRLATPAVPDEIFDQPASVALPEELGAPTGELPRPGDLDTPESGSFATAVDGIPATALYAYQRAAAILNAADPGCNLDWTLLAAIGRVESGHGRYRGSAIGADGVTRPGIIGPRLDGSGTTARITDTDGGALDNDTVYDRAVGPMQFIPGTWALVGVDADEDGSKNPQDIEDSATAAGVHLCAGSGDLSNGADKRAAVLRYNRSTTYVDHVLAVEAAYSDGDYAAVPDGTPSSTTLSPKNPEQPSGNASAPRTTRAAGSGSHGSRGGTAQAPPTDGSSGQSDDQRTPSGSSGGDESSGGDSDDRSPSPAPSPSTSPSPRKAVTQVEQRAKKTVEDTTETVTQTIGRAKAMALCEDKLEPALGLPLVRDLVPRDVERCRDTLAGTTLERAQQLLSGTVEDVVARLGL